MTDDSRTRGSDTVDRERDPDSRPDRWPSDSPDLETPLPDDVRTALGRLLGGGPVETLAEWIAEIRRRTGGGPIAAADLCHAAEETAHWGEIDGERYYFRCFYDAVILSSLAERPVAIRTESPNGTEIRARAIGTAALTVTPETAVVSFGADDTVAPPDGEPSHADVYAAVCPYVRAFPARGAYDRWRKTVPAATVAMPLAGATEIAAALVA